MVEDQEPKEAEQEAAPKVEEPEVTEAPDIQTHPPLQPVFCTGVSGKEPGNVQTDILVLGGTTKALSPDTIAISLLKLKWK